MPHPDPIVYSEFGPAPQGAGFIYSCVLTKADGVTPVPGNSISALKLTLTDVNTLAYINGRNAQNVLNANQCTFDSTGTTGQFKWYSVAADCPFLRTNPPPAIGDIEIHQAILEWTYLDINGNQQVGKHKFFIYVENYIGGAAIAKGTGSHTYTDTLYDTDQVTPLPNVELWVTSDALGSTVVAGPQNTDCNGQFTFLFQAAGTYYLWLDTSEYKFATNPVTITVT